MDMGPLAPLLPGISAELAAARLGAVFGPCPHPNAVPVELLDGGEIVAWLCPDCDTQLPVDWREQPALPNFPPVPPLPPFIPDPRLTARISE